MGLRAANVNPFKPLNGLNVNGWLLALTAAVTHLSFGRIYHSRGEGNREEKGKRKVFQFFRRVTSLPRHVGHRGAASCSHNHVSVSLAPVQGRRRRPFGQRREDNACRAGRAGLARTSRAEEDGRGAERLRVPKTCQLSQLS